MFGVVNISLLAYETCRSSVVNYSNLYNLNMGCALWSNAYRLGMSSSASQAHYIHLIATTFSKSV